MPLLKLCTGGCGPSPRTATTVNGLRGGTTYAIVLPTKVKPHPESGFASLFGKIWYEGADSAKHDWQSSGTDDFEPKMSMIPLLIGSFKGTFYALLFALPIAILGAVYTAEFMHPRFKKIVKPLIEVMASLPSVVLGFLAAIWLAPILEDRVPSLLMVVIVRLLIRLG